MRNRTSLHVRLKALHALVIEANEAASRSIQIGSQRDDDRDTDRRKNER
jgi:hypothetical protein